jgi:propionate catabolism operon transcriptional regulator
MPTERFKLGVIGSSIPLINCVRQIAEEENEDIRISLKGLEEAIPVGKEMEKAGVEVIVGRGGTSHLLRENLHIPVLTIPLTYLDILSSVKEASQMGKRVFLITFRNKLSRTEIFEELFPIEFAQGIYDDTDSLEKVIISAEKEGYDVIIGGGVSMRFAREYGLRSVELHTAKETVASVIEDAKSVAKSKKEEQAKTQRYRSIIDSTSEGIIAVDQDGLITTINKSAREALRVNNVDPIGKPLKQYVPRAQILKVLQTRKPLFNRLEKIKKDLFVSNHLPIMVGSEVIGGVVTFKDITNVMKAENEVRRSFAKGLVAKYSIDDFIHGSPIMEEVIRKAEKFAASDSTLLLSGETGTGKEIFAHSIHNLSPRKKGPFVSTNCAALPDQLLESELFGYEEGAFTGSRKGGKLGLFEIAHKGTMFLDEIGATSHSVQTRLLRVLQEKEVMRVGGDSLIPVDVRVIAATNRDLSEAVHNGSMRDDLFFRLSVLHIQIPPLRDRIEDIPLLVNVLMQRTSKKCDVPLFHIPEAAMMRLKEYSWPGNVRQLENFVERLILLSQDGFDTGIFRELYRELMKDPSAKAPRGDAAFPSLHDAQRSRGERETAIIRKALEEAQFSKTKAAKKLGISRTTLWRKLKGGT